MATIHAVNNIFNPDNGYNYYIIPSEVSYSNATITLSGAWKQTDNADFILNGSRATASHSFGFSVKTGEEKTVTDHLKFVFKNAVQNTYTGDLYNLQVTVEKVHVLNKSQIDRIASIIQLAYSYFRVESYVLVDSKDEFNDPDDSSAVTSDYGDTLGAEVSLDIRIVNSSGTDVSGGSFAYPFTDIDINTDAGGQGKGGQYVESVKIESRCTDIFVKTDTWLSWQGKSIGSSNGSTQSVSLPIRFYNGTDNTDDSPSDSTGCVAIFNAPNGKVTWSGTNCFTTMNGEGLSVYTITYNANGGEGAPGTQHKIDGKPMKLSSQIPSNSVVLTYNANGGAFHNDNQPTRTKSVRLEFLGWSTSVAKANAQDVDYHPGEDLTDDGNLTLYAAWKPEPIGALPVVGSSSGQLVSRATHRLDEDTPWTSTLNGSTQVTAETTILTNTTIYARWEYRVRFFGNGGFLSGEFEELPPDQIGQEIELVVWKKYNVALNIYHTWVMLGAHWLGYGTSPTDVAARYSNSRTATYTSNTPIDLYVVWQSETYTVTFRTGFGDNVIIKQVTRVKYGSSVPASEVPVYGQTVMTNGKVFKRSGPYSLVGWSGSLSDITCNTVLEGIWDFSPIWIVTMKDGSRAWVPYKPVE